MNAQLNLMLARERTAELQHAGEQGRLAREVRMSGRKLRNRNLITRLRARPARVLGSLIVAVMLAVLALSAPAATADPVGQITDFSTSLNQATYPVGITAGQDGDLWFADAEGAIGRIGSGAPPGPDVPASVSGTGVEGSAEVCQTPWSSWAGYAPFPRLYPFDGYAWLRDGTPIAGQTAPTYDPTAGDVGHRLACPLTVTYPLPFSVPATATGAAITVQPAPPPPPTPALSALDIAPRMFTLAGRRVGGRCQPSSRCTRPLMLRGTTVINGGAGANAFTFTGRIDGGALVPGSDRLLATPTTDGIAGQQQQTTFEITR